MVGDAPGDDFVVSAPDEVGQARGHRRPLAGEVAGVDRAPEQPAHGPGPCHFHIVDVEIIGPFRVAFRVSYLSECGSGLHEDCHSFPEFLGAGHGLSLGWS